MNAVPFGTVMIAPVAEAITADSLIRALRKTKIQVGFLVPSLIVELSQKTEY